jgi:hypothetical protein
MIAAAPVQREHDPAQAHTARAEATLGELCGALREEWGSYLAAQYPIRSPIRSKMWLGCEQPFLLGDLFFEYAGLHRALELSEISCVRTQSSARQRHTCGLRERGGCRGDKPSPLPRRRRSRAPRRLLSCDGILCGELAGDDDLWQ